MVIRCFLALVMLLATAGPLAAQQPGSILLWPVNPVIEGNVSAAALWLENKGATPITLQVEIYSWEQRDGRNIYTAQDEIIGSPPIISIQPGERQLVRLTRTTPPPVSPEKPYRIIVDEVPTHGSGAAPGAAVSFRMRYSLPLFSRAQAVGEAAVRPDEEPALRWRVGKDAEGRFIELRNEGSRHARLTQVALMNGTKKTPVSDGLLGYVLPGSTMLWPLEPQVDPSAALVASVNGMARRPIERLLE